MRKAFRRVSIAFCFVAALAVMFAGCGGGTTQDIEKSYGPMTVTLSGGELQLHYEGFDEPHLIIAGGKVLSFEIGEVQYSEQPAIILMLEDGTLEWVWANPGELEFLDEVYPLGKVPWLSGIDEVRFEEDRDDPGAMTFYAIDKSGLHYNLRELYHLLDATDQLWEYLWIPESMDYEYDFTAVMALNPDMTASITFGWEDPEDSWDTLTGTYQVYFDEETSSGYFPGTLELDLISDLDGRTVAGMYSIASPQEGSMFLWLLVDAMPLFSLNGKPVHQYEFFSSPGEYMGLPISLMDDEELSEYVRYWVPRVADLVENEGMKLVVPGTTTDMFDGLEHRDVWLGYESGSEFKVRLYYTVDPFGQIYWYDPEGDAYIIVN